MNRMANRGLRILSILILLILCACKDTNVVGLPGGRCESIMGVGLTAVGFVGPNHQHLDIPIENADKDYHTQAEVIYYWNPQAQKTPERPPLTISFHTPFTNFPLKTEHARNTDGVYYWRSHIEYADASAEMNHSTVFTLSIDYVPGTALLESRVWLEFSLNYKLCHPDAKPTQTPSEFLQFQWQTFTPAMENTGRT